MCLAIPAQIIEVANDDSLATVDILGVRRKVNVDLLSDDPPQLGEWVLVHVGFAMNKISAERAAEQIELLSMLGEATAALEEADGYDFAAPHVSPFAETEEQPLAADDSRPRSDR